jgi:hypothetical protein
MIALLVLTAILLVLSGAFKLRAAARGEVGLHLPSVLELLGGVGLLLRMTAPPVPVEQGMAAAVGAVVLIVFSSVHLSRRLADKRRLRGLTEGRRLQNFVKLQAALADEPAAGTLDGTSSEEAG